MTFANLTALQTADAIANNIHLLTGAMQQYLSGYSKARIIHKPIATYYKLMAETNAARWVLFKADATMQGCDLNGFAGVEYADGLANQIKSL